MRRLIDRPHTSNIRNLDRMVVELSPYMNEFELDQCLEFIEKIHDSRFDINPSVDDCVTQLKLIIGTDRYNDCVKQWKDKNQKLLSVMGTLKYKCKSTGKLYDGLDPTDNPNDYVKYYV